MKPGPSDEFARRIAWYVDAQRPPELDGAELGNGTNAWWDYAVEYGQYAAADPALARAWRRYFRRPASERKPPESDLPRLPWRVRAFIRLIWEPALPPHRPCMCPYHQGLRDGMTPEEARRAWRG